MAKAGDLVVVAITMVDCVAINPATAKKQIEVDRFRFIVLIDEDDDVVAVVAAVAAADTSIVPNSADIGGRWRVILIASVKNM
jgi:hypothetical protein